MPTFKIGPEAEIPYDYVAPTLGDATFVFINALTGNAGAWEEAIVPALHEKGYGTVTFNLRGQVGSQYGRLERLDETVLIGDLQALLEHIAPPRPILVGLSVGGLYAAKAWLAGTEAIGLVLINTLRKPGLRLDWINEALARVMQIGGTQAVMDFYLPMLVGPELLEQYRDTCLLDEVYNPPLAADGLLRLIREARSADWALPPEQFSIPVLVLTGMKDRVFLDIVDVRDIVDRMPNATHVELPRAGHLIPLEDPEKTSIELLKFADAFNPAKEEADDDEAAEDGEDKAQEDDKDQD